MAKTIIITESMANRLINESKSNSYGLEVFYDCLYERAMTTNLLDEFERNKLHGIKTIEFELIPKEQYKTLLTRYMQNPQMARIPEKVVRHWMDDIIIQNTAIIATITDIAGHSSCFPREDICDYYDNEELEDYGTACDFLEERGFWDWTKLPDGSDAWSDYGLDPLLKIFKEYQANATPEDILILINRCLDVYHCRGDLASAFIEGGSATCSDISMNESKTRKNKKGKDFWEKHGIKKQKIPGWNVSSIGFSEDEQKWYGWSHRAIYGFGIGSKVKKGDCAYNGKEWTAKTLDDAKKMAIDFAKDVSEGKTSLPMVEYDGCCADINKREWDRRMANVKPYPYSKIKKIIKLQYPDFYDKIGLDYYNPWENETYENDEYIIFTHSATEYFFKKMNNRLTESNRLRIY